MRASEPMTPQILRMLLIKGICFGAKNVCAGHPPDYLWWEEKKRILRELGWT